MISIYLITNLINNKKYVGQTRQSVARRWLGHIYKSKHNPIMIISKAIAKYGEENFSIHTIFEHTDEDIINEKEQEYIVEYDTHVSNGNGYNVAIGGLRRTSHPREVIQSKLDSYGIILLEEYKSNRCYHKVNCKKCGFKFNYVVGNLVQGRKILCPCPNCRKDKIAKKSQSTFNKKLEDKVISNLNRISQKFNNFGLVMLEGDISNLKNVVTCRCSLCNEVFSKRLFTCLKSGHRCAKPKEKKENKWNIISVKDFIQKRNLIMLDNEFKGRGELHKFQCKKGHVFEAIFNNVRRSILRYNNTCPLCQQESYGRIAENQSISG